MQLTVLAIISCFVLTQSASISDHLETSKIGILSDPSLDLKEEPVEQENARTKRSGAGVLSGIGNAIFGKIASASASSASHASSSSSSGSGATHDEEREYAEVEYGPPVHSYGEQNFDVWSFKKAILNTLFQALKAIGGGVIALKGQLLKGGGYVVSTKGKIISAKGEAITSLGRHIAASAVLTPPQSHQSHSSYSYGPPIHSSISDHGHTYSGPPPAAYAIHGGYGGAGAASGSYEPTAYAAPSDHGVQPGLLILKPLKPEDHLQHTAYREYRDGSSSNQVDRSKTVIEPRHPNTVAPNENFGEHQKDTKSNRIVEKSPKTASSKGKTMDEITYELTHLVNGDGKTDYGVNGNVAQHSFGYPQSEEQYTSQGVDNYNGYREHDVSAPALIQPSINTLTLHQYTHLDQHLNPEQYQFTEQAVKPHSNGVSSLEDLQAKLSAFVQQSSSANQAGLPSVYQSVSIGDFLHSVPQKPLETPILGPAKHSSDFYSQSYGPPQDFALGYNSHGTLERSALTAIDRKSHLTIQPSLADLFNVRTRSVRDERL